LYNRIFIETFEISKFQTFHEVVKSFILSVKVIFFISLHLFADIDHFICTGETLIRIMFRRGLSVLFQPCHSFSLLVTFKMSCVSLSEVLNELNDNDDVD